MLAAAKQGKGKQGPVALLQKLKIGTTPANSCALFWEGNSTIDKMHFSYTTFKEELCSK